MQCTLCKLLIAGVLDWLRSLTSERIFRCNDVDDVHAVFGLGPPAGAPGGGSLRLKKFSIEIERIERLVVRWRDPTHARRWDPTRGRAACESECAAGKEGARRAHAPTPRTIARALAMVLVP